MYNKFWQKPVHMDIRVPHTKWVILRWPNHSMAQLAQMPTSRFEDYFFSVCNLDYSKLSRAMDALVELMNRTDRVDIKGPRLTCISVLRISRLSNALAIAISRTARSIPRLCAILSTVK